MRKPLRIRIQKNGHPGALLVLAVLLVAVFVLGGCDDDPVVVDLPPSAPDGVFSITGDGNVTICWNENPERDIKRYEVYWNDEPTGLFEFVVSVPARETCYIDFDVTNGVTVFYAVLAVDRSEQESELSFEDVFDTPRPEGVNLVLFDYLGQNSSMSGYDFSKLAGTAQAQVDPSTDVYFGAPNNVPTLFRGRPEVDVQDYGFIDLVDVDWAPLAGWAPSGQIELIQGHSYIIRIIDTFGLFNMAKVSVVSVSPNSVTLDWAYQEDPDNQELAPGIGGAQR